MNTFKITMILDTGQIVEVNEKLKFDTAQEVVKQYQKMKCENGTIGFMGCNKAVDVVFKHIICFTVELLTKI